jgi:hypothetical protein
MLSIATLTREVSSPGNHTYSVLDTNGNQVIVDQQPDTTHLAQNVKIRLNIFPISPSVLQFTSYTYLKTGSVQLISGPDDSPNSVTLRFTAANNISVLSNGIELAPSEYDRSVLDQITFTPAIYEFNNIINIIVYNDLVTNVDVNNLINLEFKVIDPNVNVFDPNNPSITSLSILNENSWGNYNAVDIPNRGIHYNMHCTDLSALISDVTYGVKGAQVEYGSINAGSFIIGETYIITFVGDSLTGTDFISLGASDNNIGTIFTATGTGSPSTTGTAAHIIDIKPSEVNLLIAKDPYSFKDKELNVYLNGDSFDQTFSFIFGQDQLTGVYKLTALQSNFIQLLHPLIPTDQINSSVFDSQSTNGASTATSSIKNLYIIGPT